MLRNYVRFLIEILINQTFILFTYGEMWLLNKISCEIQILNEKVGKLMIENGKLEEENKTLKDNVEFLHQCLDDRDKSIQYAEEENKKLKEYNGELIENHKKDIAILCEENKKLQENIKWYEKEEDRLREENNRLKNNAMEDMRVQTKLEEENKKLKSDLSECECSMHFENDEVGYRKRECKKLKAELSKYKKQYQHSMGEDNGKLTKGGYASFNEYGELMEEDTLQELRDIGEITSIKDGPITYTKDSTGKWAADGEPPYVLC